MVCLRSSYSRFRPRKRPKMNERAKGYGNMPNAEWPLKRTLVSRNLIDQKKDRTKHNVCISDTRTRKRVAERQLRKRPCQGWHGFSYAYLTDRTATNVATASLSHAVCRTQVRFV